MTGARERLAELGLELPAVTPPLAAYVPAVQSGQPRVRVGPGADGRRQAAQRPARSAPRSRAEEAKELAARCALNAIAAIDALVGLERGGAGGQGGRVRRVRAEGFTGQPGVINGASELLGEVFGEAGRHARSAVGVAELPLGAPVEVEMHRRGHRLAIALKIAITAPPHALF